MRRTSFARLRRKSVAILCAALLAPSASLLLPPRVQAEATEEEAAKIPDEQLDSLVAPIALYPDPLLGQVLVASTYPLEIVQLQQWLAKNTTLKDQALVDAVSAQPWDPSIQEMAALPEVVKRLADDIQWTTELGNAFLAQQSDVMDAVQRMRNKAMANGTLTTTPEQKVETQVVNTREVIVIQQANPQVVYVPTYSPVVVYGPPVYPYPPIYYPPPGYYAAGMALSFGMGVAMGAAWSGGWGHGCGWGDNDVTVNYNNNFNRNVNVNRGSGSWQHNPQHRAGAPYADRATAGRYGGNARGDAMATRQANAQQNQANRQASAQQRQATAKQGQANRQANAQQNQANRQASAQQRQATAKQGQANRQASAQQNQVSRQSSAQQQQASRQASAQQRQTSRAAGSEKVGSRDMSKGYGGSGSSGGFGGGASGYSGSSARASSSRGASSYGGGSRSGGGGARGGGGGGRRR